jgi:hypothetical protein
MMRSVLLESPRVRHPRTKCASKCEFESHLAHQNQKDSRAVTRTLRVCCLTTALELPKRKGPSSELGHGSTRMKTDNLYLSA